MGLAARNLNDDLVLKTHKLLRTLNCIFFISALLLDLADWQAKLATFSAAPAVDFVFLCQVM